MIVRQIIMQRLQKERDSFQEEMEKMHERIELQQNQIGKMQREKENVLSELDLVKERWEKVHNSHQKLTVKKFDLSQNKNYLFIAFNFYIYKCEHDYIK